MNNPLRRRRVLTIFGALAGFVSLTGCGGGGGGSSSPASALPESRLLTPGQGQSWTYQLSGKVTTDGISANAAGTVIAAYSAAAPGSTVGAGLQLVTTGSLTAGLLSIPLDSTETIQVDSAGNESVIAVQPGASAALESLKTSILLIPGTFSPSFAYSGSTTTTDGATPYSVTFKVVGEQTITVPAGTFNTWKVQSTLVEGTVTTTETEYFAPEIGNFVEATTTAVDSSSSKSSLSLTAELTSTTAGG